MLDPLKGGIEENGRDLPASLHASPLKRQPVLSASKQRHAYCAHAPEPYAALASRGDWSTELWDVCAQPGGANLCCLSLWCPCIQYGLLLEQLPPGSVACAGSAVGSCALFCVLWLLGDLLGAGLLKIMPLPCTALVHAQTRGHLRRKYGIQSHPLHDFFITWCCAPCALCQEAREAVIRAAAEREDSLTRLKSPSRSGSTHGPLDRSGHRPGTPGGKAAAAGTGAAVGSPFASGGLLGTPPAHVAEGAGVSPALVRATEASGDISHHAFQALGSGLPPAVGSPPPPSPPPPLASASASPAQPHSQRPQPQPHTPPRAVQAVATIGAVRGGAVGAGHGAMAVGTGGGNPSPTGTRPRKPD